MKMYSVQGGNDVMGHLDGVLDGGMFFSLLKVLSLFLCFSEFMNIVCKANEFCLCFLT